MHLPMTLTPCPNHPAGKQRVAPLVEQMLSATDHEMGRYARIIQYWPTYGQVGVSPQGAAGALQSG